MKVRMTFEFDDKVRKALAHHYGESGRATRDVLKSSIDNLVTSWVQDICSDMDNDPEGQTGGVP